MSKHTPGPWRVYVPESVGATFGVDSVDGNAVVWFGPTSDDGIRRIEDARLIAAAPDLLEALILLEHEMVESGNAGSKDFGWKPAIEKTRAAIAKATGVGHE